MVLILRNSFPRLDSFAKQKEMKPLQDFQTTAAHYQCALQREQNASFWEILRTY